MNRAIRLITATVVLAAAATLHADDAERAKANKVELEKLQGKWKVESLLVRGEEVEEFKQLGIVFDFKDDKLTVTGDSAGFTTQTRFLRLDANTSPKLLDFAETAKALPFHFHKPRDVKYVRNGGNPVLHPRTAFTARADQPSRGAPYRNVIVAHSSFRHDTLKICRVNG